jgi:transposase
LAKLGESVTETLESTPRTFKVIQHVREKFTCRDCEKINQEPAPFHTIPRAFAGPSLLAMIAYDKFGLHQPLNRQSERFALEGVALSVSTLADLIGATCVALKPVYDFIKSMVFTGERVHGDDTTVPVMARGQTDIARVWVYVRNDRPFSGSGPPCAVFYYSRDRAGIHPQTHLAEYSGIFQADAYGGYNKLYEPNRSPGPIIEAACWAKLAKVPPAQRVESQRRGTRAENSSNWPISRVTPNAKLRVRRPPLSPQWRWLRCSGSTRCSRSSGASMAGRLPTAWQSASSSARRWSPSWRGGCAPSAPNCRVTTMSPKRWTTC